MEDLDERRIYMCRLRFRPSPNDDEQAALYKKACNGALVEMRLMQPCNPDGNGYTGEWQMQFTAPGNNWAMFANTGEVWMPSGDVEFLDNRLIYDILDDISEMTVCRGHEDVADARAHYMLKGAVGKDNVASLLKCAYKWKDVTYGEM